MYLSKTYRYNRILLGYEKLLWNFRSNFIKKLSALHALFESWKKIKHPSTNSPNEGNAWCKQEQELSRRDDPFCHSNKIYISSA